MHRSRTNRSLHPCILTSVRLLATKRCPAEGRAGPAGKPLTSQLVGLRPQGVRRPGIFFCLTCIGFARRKIPPQGLYSKHRRTDCNRRGMKKKSSWRWHWVWRSGDRGPLVEVLLNGRAKDRPWELNLCTWCSGCLCSGMRTHRRKGQAESVVQFHNLDRKQH